MSALEIVVIVVAVLIVLSVIVWCAIRKSKGKSACGCDCAVCKHNCSRSASNNQEKSDEIADIKTNKE